MNHWTRRIGPMLALGMLFVSAWNLWSYNGPYRWFAELQLGMPGASYDLTLTFLLTYLTWLIACLPVLIPLRIVNGRQAADPAIDAWLENNRMTLVLGILAVGLTGMGTFFAIDASSMGELIPVDVATLEAGADPASRYVDLQGGVARSYVARGVESSDVTWIYVPVGTSNKHEYAVFLRMSEAEFEQLDASRMHGPWRGVLYDDALPGMLRDSWDDDGMLAPEHTVLRTDVSPRLRWGLAGAMGGCGLLFAVALAVVRARSSRRTPSASPPASMDVGSGA